MLHRPVKFRTHVGATLLAMAMLCGVADAATVKIDFGNVSAGYRDGYRDSNNGWHSWRTADASRYRKAHGEQYHAWRHDDPKHQGDADHR